MTTQDWELKMLQSISEELGVPNLLDVLSTAPLRRLQPILVHASKNRAKGKKATDLFREYEEKQEIYGIGTMSQRELHNFTRICHEAVAPNFDIVQTSPIAPLGLNSVLSRVSQNNTLSTIRGSEVVSDVTTQLALECALRRKKKWSDLDEAGDQGIVNVCTSSRVLRLQPFDKTRGYMQHFNLFALCSGGKNSRAAGGFAVPMLQAHIALLLDVLYALKKAGYYHEDIEVGISDMRFLENLLEAQDLPRVTILSNSLNDNFDIFKEYNVHFPAKVANANTLNPEMFAELGLIDRTTYYDRVEQKIMEPLRKKYPDVKFYFDFSRKSGLGYYPHLCFHIFAKSCENNVVQIADGGAVDWSAKLLGNTREAMVTSGIGSELIQKLFSKKDVPVIGSKILS